MQARIRRERTIKHTAISSAALASSLVVLGIAHDALNDTTRYENGLTCSGESDITVSGGEELSSVAKRDAARLGISQESTSKLLTLYFRENSPFSFTYDESSTAFIHPEVTQITSAETCSD